MIRSRLALEGDSPNSYPFYLNEFKGDFMPTRMVFAAIGLMLTLLVPVAHAGGDILTG